VTGGGYEKTSGFVAGSRKPTRNSFGIRKTRQQRTALRFSQYRPLARAEQTNHGRRPPKWSWSM
jgi:hypothetical protein